MQLIQPGGEIITLKKSDLARVIPMPNSYMPEGLIKDLSPDEIRDLMT